MNPHTSIPERARVLVLGTGGREHALAWKCRQSPLVEKVLISSAHVAVPEEDTWNFPLKGGEKEFHEIGKKAQQEKIDLCIVGPDNPLSEGVVDILISHGLQVFGPKKAAARLEGSKSFAKKLMESSGVPTPKAFLFEDKNAALKKLSELSWNKPWVLKADGLALGKGVVICQTLQEAQESIGKLFEFQGHKVLIEEFVRGQEVSWMALCDGEHFVLLDPAQDYKRVFDGNLGPNTGGMGAFSPVPAFSDFKLREYVRENVFRKIVMALKNEGTPFCGVLYAGLMVDFSSLNAHGIPEIFVLEFNARLGDPEAQVLLPRMKDDFFELAYLCAQGKLKENHPHDVLFHQESAVYVVAASKGYPDQPLLHQKIKGPERSFSLNPKTPEIFYAGVKKDSGEYVTSGGRVCGALGWGADLKKARENAYENLKNIQFEGMVFRKDIAQSECLNGS